MQVNFLDKVISYFKDIDKQCFYSKINGLYILQCDLPEICDPKVYFIAEQVKWVNAWQLLKRHKLTLHSVLIPSFK